MKKNYVTPSMNIFHVKISAGLLAGSNPIIEGGGDDLGNGISSSKRKNFGIWVNEDENPEDEW